MDVYIEEEFEAETLDDLKRQMEQAAVTAWKNQLAFKAQMAARGPIEPGPFDLTDATDTWEQDMLANTTRKSRLLAG